MSRVFFACLTENAHLSVARVSAIAWWKPDGSETYRIIYGDLSIRDVASEDWPASGQEQNRK
ncbi:hypothetical protein AMJ85_01955 [candidate division BRC1 bacterium SM23_51]|nr:MAG: hypothetical protein AMJ85_01955 [candidate division BRC1 bacterium SM23_51]